jgi:glutamate dehydrogenase/leucine dehydrogenase
MKPYPDLAAAVKDAQRLAGGMTYKWAAAGLEAGGGKAVIAVPEDLGATARTDLLDRYAHLVSQLGGLFMTGPDSGTTAEDMDRLGERAAGFVFCRTEAAGGSGNPAPFTALGVFTAIRAGLQQIFGTASMEGIGVSVQGVGAVGRELIPRLVEAGAVVTCADVVAGATEDMEARYGVSSVPAESIVETPCEVFSPCALGGVLSEETIPRLECRLVAGAANNQLAAPGDGPLLRERGILYAPDFVASSGGAIAAIGMETRGLSRSDAEQRVVESVEVNLAEIFESADREGIDTAAAARRLAERRLAAGPETA